MNRGSLFFLRFRCDAEACGLWRRGVAVCGQRLGWLRELNRGLWQCGRAAHAWQNACGLEWDRWRGA